MGLQGNAARPTSPLYVHSFTSYGPVSVANQLGMTGPNAGSGGWPTANLAIFLPFNFPFYYRARRIFSAVGSATGPNKAIGVYTRNGALIEAQSSTAVGGVNSLDYWTPTSPLILKGFWIGLVYSATTGNASFGLIVTANQGRLMGLRQQAMGSVTLPANMESTVQWASTWCPLVGATRLATGN